MYMGTIREPFRKTLKRTGWDVREERLVKPHWYYQVQRIK